MEDEENSLSEFYYPDEIGERAGDEELLQKNSQEEIEAFLIEQKAKNTVKKTKSDLNILQRYLDSISEGETEIFNLPLAVLDHLLCKFFMNIKKDDGSDYEPNTLSSYQRSIQRFLEEKNYPGNILKDKEFEKSRKVLAAKRKSLVNSGKGNRPQATRALTEEEEDELFSKGQFGDHDPEVLQRTIWWFLSLHFGFRARDESRKLRWGDVQLQTDSEGSEFLTWISERGSKTRRGQERGHQRAFQPKAYSTSNERCPVRLYKKFRSHRPVEMNNDEAPFFLAVKHKRSQNDNIWYMKAPLGKNQIGQFLSKAAKNAGILEKTGGKLSNHSVRKTSISRLLDEDIPENFVAQLSGHKNTESLQSYKSAGEKHQKQMSMVLSRVSRDILSTNSLNNVQPATVNNALQICPSTNQVSAAATTCTATSADNSKNSSFFSGVHNVEGCSFQIFNGEVNVHIHGKRRRVIESDDED